jgi:hypothetical protein
MTPNSENLDGGHSAAELREALASIQPDVVDVDTAWEGHRQRMRGGTRRVSLRGPSRGAAGISFARALTFAAAIVALVGLVTFGSLEIAHSAGNQTVNPAHHPTPRTSPTTAPMRDTTTTSLPRSTTSTTSAKRGSSPNLDLPISSVSSVSCADVAHCWAGAVVSGSSDEAVILASADGGSAWTEQYRVSGVDLIGQIDCPSDSHCLAVGDRTASNQPPLILSTTNGGTKWSEQSMSTDLYELDAIWCSNDLQCLLVGAQPQNDEDIIEVTSDWGKTWTVQNRSSIDVSMGVTYGISCPSSATCVVVGNGSLTTTNGGSNWQLHSLPGELNVVSCPSVNTCVAEEDVTSAVTANQSTIIFTSGDGGASWHRVETVGGDVSVLESLSCPSASLCVSVGGGYNPTPNSSPNTGDFLWGAVERSVDGGTSWSGLEQQQATYLYSVSCVTGTEACVAVGTLEQGKDSVGIVLRSVDGGSSWTSETIPTG